MATDPSTKYTNVFNSANDAIWAYDELLQDTNFTAPNVDPNDPAFQLGTDLTDALNKSPKELTNSSLTKGEPINATDPVDDAGTFDVLMLSVKKHLMQEYESNRITGQEYVKAYIELTQSVMSNATQFLINREQSYWQAITAQIAAVNASASLAKTRIEVASLNVDLENRKADYALSKMNLAVTGVTYDKARFETEELLPLQRSGLEYDNDLKVTAHDKALYEIDTLLPLQKSLTEADISLKETSEDKVLYEVNTLLPLQADLNEEQIIFTHEKAEAEHAKTAEERLAEITQTGDIDYTAHPAINGILGKQTALYDEQRTSYIKEGRLKAAKMFTDGWMTDATVNSGVVVPPQFQFFDGDDITQAEADAETSTGADNFLGKILNEIYEDVMNTQVPG